MQINILDVTSHVQIDIPGVQLQHSLCRKEFDGWRCELIHCKSI